MNKKAKLIEKREERGFTQKEIAEKLCMEVSSYSRRENGHTKIPLNNWAKLALILNCQIEDIYEDDENQSFTFNDSTIGNFCTSNNAVSITIPENLLETSQKYIKILEKKIEGLEKEILELKMLIKT